MKASISSVMATLFLSNLAHAQTQLFGSADQVYCHTTVTNSALYIMGDKFMDWASFEWKIDEAFEASNRDIDLNRAIADKNDDQGLHAYLNLRRFVEVHIFAAYRETGNRLQAIEAGHRACTRLSLPQ